MKMDFNLVRQWLRSLSQRHLRTSLALMAFLGAGGLLSAGPMQLRSASAQTTYFTARTVLAEFFPKSQNVGYQRFELTPDQRARLERRLGGLKPSRGTRLPVHWVARMTDFPRHLRSAARS